MHADAAENGPESGLDWSRLAAHREARYQPSGTEHAAPGTNGGNLMAADESSEKIGFNADASSPSSREPASQSPEGIVADPARFFDYVYTLPLRRMILGIVENEGPMTLHRLARRVAQEHGWQRAGRRIQERVQKNLGRAERHCEFGVTFVWGPGRHADRVPFRGLSDRSIRDVSRAEIASVIDAHSGKLARAEDPILALSRHLGVSRLSKDARGYLSDCSRWHEESNSSETK